jgi:hypothetical protein
MIWSYILTVSTSKQNKIRHLKLVGHIVERLMPIGTEEDPEDADEDSASRVSFMHLFLSHNNSYFLLF